MILIDVVNYVASLAFFILSVNLIIDERIKKKWSNAANIFLVAAAIECLIYLICLQKVNITGHLLLLSCSMFEIIYSELDRINRNDTFNDRFFFILNISIIICNFVIIILSVYEKCLI